MKPEKLAMSAFGPYRERTEIDRSVFDGSGLYLVYALSFVMLIAGAIYFGSKTSKKEKE